MHDTSGGVRWPPSRARPIPSRGGYSPPDKSSRRVRCMAPFNGLEAASHAGWAAAIEAASTSAQPSGANEAQYSAARFSSAFSSRAWGATSGDLGAILVLFLRPRGLRVNIFKMLLFQYKLIITSSCSLHSTAKKWKSA
jgi:hypothetical protein